MTLCAKGIWDAWSLELQDKVAFRQESAADSAAPSWFCSFFRIDRSPWALLTRLEEVRNNRSCTINACSLLNGAGGRLEKLTENMNSTKWLSIE